jgi:hypothetical protein
VKEATTPRDFVVRLSEEIEHAKAVGEHLHETPELFALAQWAKAKLREKPHNAREPNRFTMAELLAMPEMCPKCDGPMWDNRESKRQPRSPDYRCKDRNCDGSVWLTPKPT